MNTTVPLPPWLRKFQQTFAYQAVLVPFVVGFGGFLVADGCLSNGIFAIQAACVKSAFSGFAISLITVFISGKSVGSPSFKADGTTNTTVNNVVAVQAAAANGHPEMQAVASSIDRSAALAANAVKTP